jgi:hypothetical protein
MMREVGVRIVAVALGGLLAAAIAGCSRADVVYRALYDGLQIREDAASSSLVEQPTVRRPDYWEYTAERHRALNERQKR